MITAAIKRKLLQAGAGALVMLLLAAGATILYYKHQADRWHRQSVQNWFSADSAKAAADSTREISDRNATLARIRGQGFEIVQRQVVQQTLRGDSLDRALQLQAKVNADLTFQLAELRTRSTSTQPVVQTPEGVRSAEFQVSQVPFTGSARVALPPAPAKGTLDLSLKVAPAMITQRIGCTDPDSQGGRSAFATIVTPSWLSVTIDRVEQSRDVCNAGFLQEKVPRFTTKVFHTARDVAAIAGLTWGITELVKLLRGER